MVRAATKELELLNLKSSSTGRPTQFFVSGCPKQFGCLAARWLGYVPQVNQVNFAAVATSKHYG